MGDGRLHDLKVRPEPVGAGDRVKPGSRSTPAAGVPAITCAARIGMIGDTRRSGSASVSSAS